MAKIVVEIRGGVVQSVTSDALGHSVLIIDYDDIEAGDPAPSEFVPVRLEPRQTAQVTGVSE